MSKPFNADIYLAQKFLNLKEIYNLDTVIETGTFKAATTIWLSEHFDKVYTVECHEHYFEIATQKLENAKNVVSKLQYSELFLKEIMPLIDDTKTIVFLDAHWYKNPLLNELLAIKQSGKKPILAIHDFMVPNHPELKYDTYPKQNIVYDWQYIENHINDIYGIAGYNIEYNTEATGAMRGCVFILPKI